MVPTGRGRGTVPTGMITIYEHIIFHTTLYSHQPYKGKWKKTSFFWLVSLHGTNMILTRANQSIGSKISRNTMTRGHIHTYRYTKYRNLVIEGINHSIKMILQT